MYYNHKILLLSHSSSEAIILYVETFFQQALLWLPPTLVFSCHKVLLEFFEAGCGPYQSEYYIQAVVSHYFNLYFCIAGQQ